MNFSLFVTFSFYYWPFLLVSTTPLAITKKRVLFVCNLMINLVNFFLFFLFFFFVFLSSSLLYLFSFFTNCKEEMVFFLQNYIFNFFIHTQRHTSKNSKTFIILSKTKPLPFISQREKVLIHTKKSKCST